MSREGVKASPALRGCRIYVHDVAQVAGIRLHERYTPCGWPHVQHAVETWLSRTLERSEWRVSSPADADLIYLDGHDFSRWCTASRLLAMRNTQNRIERADERSESACPHVNASDRREPKFAAHVLKRRAQRGQVAAAAEATAVPVPIFRDEISKRKVWQLMMETSAALVPPTSPHGGGGARRTPRVVALTSKECPRPFPGVHPKESDLVLLVDQNPRADDVVTPLVVSQPPWLAGVPHAEPPAVPPWPERRLLFFAGHTPKVTQSATRYLLWKQLRRSPHVTALSSTIGCNVASYEGVCQSPKRMASEYGSFCQPFCGSRIQCTASEAVLQRHCRLIARHVNFTDESADLRRAGRDLGGLSHLQYLALARSHRFCLVAPGDFVATHKISEAMALGGTGGCIPVLVVPARARVMLPYLSWLDYCSVSYIVDINQARTNASAVVQALLAVSPAEAARKLRALARLRDAFVFREGSSPQQPSAAEFILEEMCRVARQYSTGVRSASQRLPTRGGASRQFNRASDPQQLYDLSRCML